MWWIIIIVIAFIVIKFALDANKQADSVIKQGGMRKKYRVLIDNLLSGNENSKIFSETTTFVSLGVRGLGGSTIFNIQQTFGTVSIKWNAENPIFGRHTLNWSFDEFFDQYKMLDKISNDINTYQSNIMQKFM